MNPTTNTTFLPALTKPELQINIVSYILTNMAYWTVRYCSLTKTYLNIFFLLQLEHVHVKLLLKLLISIIDAKLFKGVCLESFKAIDVENSDELVDFVRCFQCLIYLEDNPVKEIRIYALSQCIPSLRGLKHFFSLKYFSQYFV